MDESGVVMVFNFIFHKNSKIGTFVNAVAERNAQNELIYWRMERKASEDTEQNVEHQEM